MLAAENTRWMSVVILFLLILFGCTTFDPRPEVEVPFRERAETQSEGDIRVTAAVPSAEESRKLFGVDLYKRGIQPIWLEIQNNSQKPAWFLPASVDPEYYTPLEVAYMYHTDGAENLNQQMNRFFYERGMGLYTAPGGSRSGYVFTQVDEGTKTFIVDVLGEDKNVRSFIFYIPVPGLRFDHHNVDWENLYKQDEIISHDEKGIREVLGKLPCCTTNKKGTEQGDPLNIVVIGDTYDVYHAFVRAGWDETETIYSTSLLKTARSFVIGGEYRYSPVSGLYVFGRKQDVAFQKARGTIHERNHLRLWLAPMRFEGQLVWIGQISRDIGVRFTTKTITTHKIDPDVDETRNFLIEDLAYAQALKKFGYVQGVGSAPFAEPRANLTDDPYFTDGLRAVLWLTSKPTSFATIEYVEWEDPAEGLK